MNIIIPSKDHAKVIEGFDYFDTALYCVPESQFKDYLDVLGSRDRILCLPDNCDGDVSSKRNWILKNVERPLLMIDDDVDGIMYCESGVCSQRLDKKDFLEFAENGFVLCSDLGSKMWGINNVSDLKSYHEFKPISLSQVVMGAFQGHLEHSLTYDSRVGTKCGYDMSLQHLHKYKKLLKLNKYSYSTKRGGIKTLRSKIQELKYCEAIMNKWGSNVIKYNLEAKRAVDLLKVKSINIPIRGV